MRTQAKQYQQTGGGCRLASQGWQREDRSQPSPERNASRLAETSAGRVLLHLLCLCHDHHLQWHWSGIRREFSGR
jgi:hypothetical protein